MLELGSDEIFEHVALAQNPHLLEADVVHCVGPRMRACYEALPGGIRGCWTETAAEFSVGLSELIVSGDTVLVKGSLGSQVSMIVDLIRNLGQRSQPRV
jgi:UDP-N-acetylmuramoyl-tripeptide--D-alanyl-D-alanine ligase